MQYILFPVQVLPHLLVHHRPIPSKYSFGAEKIMLSMYGVISMSISTKLRKWEERYIKNILLEPSEQNKIF